MLQTYKTKHTVPVIFKIKFTLHSRSIMFNIFSNFRQNPFMTFLNYFAYYHSNKHAHLSGIDQILNITQPLLKLGQVIIRTELNLLEA